MSNTETKLNIIHQLINLHDNDKINDLVVVGSADDTGSFFFASTEDMYGTFGYAMARFNDMIKQQENSFICEGEDNEDE